MTTAAPAIAAGERMPRGSAAVSITVSALACLGFWWLSRSFPIHTDDAYITYRYAANLAAGDGFVYNAGERVLGTSTPLYTLLLAAASRLGADIPDASRFLGGLSVGTTVGTACWWLSRRAGSSAASLLAVLLLFSFGEAVHLAVAGMETNLYVLLIIASLYCYDRGRVRTSAVFAGLCCLTRMDGIAVALALGGHHVLTRRRLPGPGAILAFLLVVTPWVVFAAAYFGDVRPQSMLAKHEHPITAGRWWMAEFLVDPKTSVLLPLVALGVRRCARAGRGCPGFAVLALWTAFYTTAFTVYRIDLYRWYLIPIATALALLATLGFGSAWVEWSRVSPRSSAMGPGLVIGLVVGLLAAIRVPPAIESVRNAALYNATLARSRVDVARAIRGNAGDGDVLATGAIGIAGWITGLRIHDIMGLVTKDAVGRPLAEQLAASGAKWYVSQDDRGPVAPRQVPGFTLVERFQRHPRIAFLLYERD